MSSLNWNVKNAEAYLEELRKGSIGCSDCGVVMSHNEIEKAIKGENLCPEGIPICDKCRRGWEYYFWR